MLLSACSTSQESTREETTKTTGEDKAREKGVTETLAHSGMLCTVFIMFSFASVMSLTLPSSHLLQNTASFYYSILSLSFFLAQISQF